MPSQVLRVGNAYVTVTHWENGDGSHEAQATASRSPAMAHWVLGGGLDSNVDEACALAILHAVRALKK